LWTNQYQNRPVLLVHFENPSAQKCRLSQSRKFQLHPDCLHRLRDLQPVLFLFLIKWLQMLSIKKLMFAFFFSFLILIHYVFANEENLLFLVNTNKRTIIKRGSTFFRK